MRGMPETPSQTAQETTSETTGNRAARFSYGWVIVIASLVLLVGSFGTQLCFGVFLKPLIAEFGWTRAAASGTMSLAMGVSGLIGVAMGRLTDRFDVRIAIAIAAALGTICYMFLARMHSLWEFYLYFGLGGGICIGSTYAPVAAIVSKWFQQRRALALGIALMGIGVGQMTLSPLAAHLIEGPGWRTTYMVLGIIILVCALPALVLLGRIPPQAAAPDQTGSGDRPPTSDTARCSASAPTDMGALSPTEGMTVRQAARTAPFWMIMITGVAIAAGSYIVAAHVVSAATDAGIAGTAAALILTVNSVAGILGTVGGAWWLAERLGHRRALMILCAGQAIALFLLALASSLWAFYVTSAFLGFFFAASTPVRQAMVPPLFGLKSVGAVLGFAYLAWSIGAVVGPYLGGLIHDLTQSYDLAFILAGTLLFVGTASIYVWGSHKARATDADRAMRETAEPGGASTGRGSCE
jgi:MFS family permease